MFSRRRLTDFCNTGRRRASVTGLRYVVLTLKVCLFLAFGCSCSAALESNRTIAQFAHTAWGPKDGAPSVVTALAQSTDGYLWLGSSDGLYRFDGVVFERYQPQSGRPIPGRSVAFTFGPSQRRPLDRLSIRRDQLPEKRTRHELYHPRRSASGSGIGLRAGSRGNDLGCD